MRHAPHALILLAGLCLSACGMPDEELAPITMITEEQEPQSNLQDLVKPLLDPLPAAVCAASVPLQGTVRPGASVFIFGSALPSGLTTDAHPTTGRFCLDLPLLAGVLNTFEVRALDSQGTSEPSQVAITQKACASEDGQAPEQPAAKNVALGVWPITSKEAASGDRLFLTDGNPSTVTVYESTWLSTVGKFWISLDLGEVRRIEKVVVRWRDYQGRGTAYASWYKLVASSMEFAGDPLMVTSINAENEYEAELLNSNWSDLAEVRDGDGCQGGTCGADVFEFDPHETSMRHLAIWLGMDGGGWGSFAIAEIEVWEAASTVSGQPPLAQAATCANQAPVY